MMVSHGQRYQPVRRQDEPIHLDVDVVHTEVEATRIALRQAVRLASGLPIRIRIVVAVVVPLPLPLESPQVGRGHLERRFRGMAETTGVETSVRICYCRDQKDAFESLLPAGSVIVIGGIRRRWWRGRAERTAELLEKAGHLVFFVEAHRNAGSVLPHRGGAVLPRLLGSGQSLRKALKEEFMEYALAGTAAILLFAYLLCALVMPEWF